MSSPFIAAIIMFGGNFAPRGWATCSGQILPIAQNTALFSILGTTYGGNGQTTFALPDLRGRVPNGMGQGPGLSAYTLGQQGGEENHTLITAEMPAHTHAATFASTSTLSAAQVPSTNQQAQTTPQSMLARSVDGAANGTALPRIYAPATSTPTVPIGGLNVAGTVTNAVTGGGQPHNNLQPYLTLNFIIALQGIFPSRN
ncbi:MAG TPA: tail fiber protein [Novosphingobium sp.]|nr:tail fiber protein [Novosphingobium sp.]